MRNADPAVSFVIPARNEASFLGQTLDSLTALASSLVWEAIVVDDGSTDGTVEIASSFGASVLQSHDEGQGEARDLGARHANGEWLVFLDADTTVRADYLDRMLSFLDTNDLRGGASQCRITGGWRTRVYEILYNHILYRLSPPVLPGFHLVVDRTAYFDVGGFETGPNEDVTFSRRLGRSYPIGICPELLVETSGRRIESDGLVRTTAHYTRKEWRRQRFIRRK